MRTMHTAKRRYRPISRRKTWYYGRILVRALQAVGYILGLLFIRIAVMLDEDLTKQARIPPPL